MVCILYLLQPLALNTARLARYVALTESQCLLRVRIPYVLMSGQGKTKNRIQQYGKKQALMRFVKQQNFIHSKKTPNVSTLQTLVSIMIIVPIRPEAQGKIHVVTGEIGRELSS